MKKSFYLVYDIDFGGDYEGLFTWLDMYQAKECGSCVAVIKDYEYEGDFIEYLKSDLEKNVKIDKNIRIYVIYKETHKGKVVGRFIFGNRKRAPWSGYYIREIESEEID